MFRALGEHESFGDVTYVNIGAENLELIEKIVAYFSQNAEI